MKKIVLLILLIVVNISCKEKESAQDSTKTFKGQEPNFAIAIHGGAGTILKKNMTPEKEAAYRAKLEEAVTVGYTVLKQGGTSLDAVTKTINILEDSPLFNAGKGAVFTSEETNELDASIMDGETLNAGASAGTKTVKNPINLARAVMEHSPHVLLSGKGAETFAKEQGLEIVNPDYFFTEPRFQSLKRVKEKENPGPGNLEKTSFYNAEIRDSKFGTVGCVALDKNGNLAAGTSTGGMTNKRWGRIGDTPIIGSGTYANNTTCAVSSTGWGEYFIRAQVAYDISALMEYKGVTLKEAARIVIHDKLATLGGTGGIIAVDKNGSIVFEFNTAGMYRASMNNEGDLTVAIYQQD